VTSGLHALIDRLAVLLRQIDAAHADIDHVDAERLRLAIELLADAAHQLLALVAHDPLERGFADHAAQRAGEQRREPRIGSLDGADRLIELERVHDLVAGEGIHHEPLLVRRDDFLRRVVEVEDALVDIDHVVDQRDLVVQPRSGDDVDRLAEANDQGLAGLVDREQRAVRDNQRNNDERGDEAANQVQSHRAPPGCCGCGRRCNSLSGR
jgi:hypothetical protein